MDILYSILLYQTFCVVCPVGKSCLEPGPGISPNHLTGLTNRPAADPTSGPTRPRPSQSESGLVPSLKPAPAGVTLGLHIPSVHRPKPSPAAELFLVMCILSFFCLYLLYFSAVSLLSDAERLLV